MKAVFGLLGLIVVLGIVYGLAFFGIIPAQKLADGSPALASALIPLHLAKAKKTAHAAHPGASAPSPEQQALTAQKKQIEADRAALDKEKADFETQKTPAAPPADGSAPDANVPSDANAKLDAIYAAMSPDDLTPIFGKLGDLDVARALLAMDEKKAGKILAALPADRAARLTRRMTSTTQTASASGTVLQPASL